MLNLIWRRYWFDRAPDHRLEPQMRKRRQPRFCLRLEELETRLAPASFAVNALLEVSRLDDVPAAPDDTRAVVFFESAVTDYQILSQGLAAGTDSVLLDSAGDGVREMAAFLAGRHNLTSVGLVAHGSAGMLALGTTSLDVANVGGYARELAVLGSALVAGGELDLWSCEVGADQQGESLVRALAVATGGGVAASAHIIGDAVQGGDWQLDVRVGSARGETPFAAAALRAYHEILSTWTAAGSMATPRANQTATLLPSGKVLVTGGLTSTGPTSTGYLASAELYDPVTDTWSSAGSMASARYQQTATLLGNGKVLVAGGQDNGSNVLASAELYDPVSNSWSAAGPMNVARDQQTATLLGNGKVLVTGGVDGTDNALASAELYDPTANAWSPAGALATGRFLHTATLLSNGNVLVAGGYDSGLNVLASAELYDPVTNMWSGAGSMTSPRVLHTATLVASKVLVTGGLDNNAGPQASAELYDPATNTWSAAKSMATARDQQTATLVNGKVLVAGGADNNTNPLSSTEMYDPVSNTWSGAGSMTGPRGDQTATLLANNKVLVAGGFSPDIFTFLASAELFDPANSATTSSFTVIVPATATTGTPFNITVTALDHAGNLAAGYNGLVHFTSSDPAALLPADTALTGGQGVISFTFNTAGNQTITATDLSSSNPVITGTSSPVVTRGLVVVLGGFTTTATGFSVAFSKAFIPGDITLFGPGQTVQDVTLVGAATGSIGGSLIIDPSNTKITFNATANTLGFFNSVKNPTAPPSVVLPDDTYTVTLVSGSGSNGFLDTLNAGLDGGVMGGNGGHANFTTTFTTHYQANKTPVLGIPDFARGPDDAHPVKMPNDSANGIPITLYNAAGVTDVSFTLNYNPTLLTVTNGSTLDSSAAGSSFTLVATPTITDATHATATFHYSIGSAQSGTLVLGDIVATVPNSSKTSYKVKELLQLDPISVNQAAFTGVSASGIHINAYFGDVSGDGVLDALDVAKMAVVASAPLGTDTGFAAYQQLDPAVVGDIADDISVDAGDLSTLKGYLIHLPAPALPVPPGLTGIVSPNAADPTLSLVGTFGPAPDASGPSSGKKANVMGEQRAVSPALTGDPVYNVSVTLDHPRPDGSSGLTEAILALTYDPSVLCVSAADITLGSIPGLGTGWQLTAVVDAATGQIGIGLYSTTPISDKQAGTLVKISFHVLVGEEREFSPPRPAATLVQLVDSATPNGQQFGTLLADEQGAMVLSPGPDRLTASEFFPTFGSKRPSKRK